MDQQEMRQCTSDVHFLMKMRHPSETVLLATLEELWFGTDEPYEALMAVIEKGDGYKNPGEIEDALLEKLIELGFVFYQGNKPYETGLRLHARRMSKILFSYFRRFRKSTSNENGNGNCNGSSKRKSS